MITTINQHQQSMNKKDNQYKDHYGQLLNHYQVRYVFLFMKIYTLKEKDVIKLGKQKLKVREVVPADLNASVIIPAKGDIKLTKAVYDQLALK